MSIGTPSATGSAIKLRPENPRPSDSMRAALSNSRLGPLAVISSPAVPSGLPSSQVAEPKRAIIHPAPKAARRRPTGQAARDQSCTVVAVPPDITRSAGRPVLHAGKQPRRHVAAE